MPDIVKYKKKLRHQRRSPLVLLLLLLLWSLAIGGGLAIAMTPDARGSVDPVPRGYQIGQELYLETCAGCHTAVPPAVFPTETWRDLLLEPNHYSTKIQLPVDPQRLLVWNYLQLFSRPLAPGGQTPYRLGNSRYFKALHPKVPLPDPVSLNSCVTCHIGAAAYNFRSLTPEWQDSP